MSGPIRSALVWMAASRVLVGTWLSGGGVLVLVIHRRGSALGGLALGLGRAAGGGARPEYHSRASPTWSLCGKCWGLVLAVFDLR